MKIRGLHRFSVEDTLGLEYGPKGTETGHHSGRSTTTNGGRALPHPWTIFGEKCEIYNRCNSGTGRGEWRGVHPLPDLPETRNKSDDKEQEREVTSQGKYNFPHGVGERRWKESWFGCVRLSIQKEFCYGEIGLHHWGVQRFVSISRRMGRRGFCTDEHRLSLTLV